jgi:glycosyltransferase involved in cell wall biosynthesis
MKPLNILFLSHRFYPFTGGIEVNSEILATEFTKRGHHVRLLTWTKETGNKEFPFYVLRNPSFGELWKNHRWADVVFENNPCYRLSWPLHFTRSKSVIAIRTLINRANGEIAFQDKLKFKHLNRADQVIAVSSAIRDACWPDATVIPNPFRNTLFRRIPEIERNKDFVFLGRMVSQKRCDLNIKLLAELKKSHPDRANLTVIGDGPEYENLRAMTNDLGLAGNVKFVGEMKGEELVRELNKYRYMLIPSDFEAFGNVALEGIACGNLPIVSDSGGLVDAIGEAGLSFKSSNLESFYETTVKLLENPGLEQAIRKKADTHLSIHEPQKIAGRYLDVIESAFDLNSKNSA